MFKLRSALEEVKTWMTKNKLKLNDSKMEFFIATNKQDAPRLVNMHLNLQDVTVLPSTSVRNLGVVFDTSMKMNETRLTLISNCELSSLESVANSALHRQGCMSFCSSCFGD